MSHARERVTAHGANLLATAAALGATAGCSKPDPVKPEPTATSTTTTATASATASANPIVSATASATASATPSATATSSGSASAALRSLLTAPTHGYAVVDPMPMPSRCVGSAASAKGTGIYVTAGGETVLKVTVKLGGGTTWTGVTPMGHSETVKSVSANAAKDSIDVFVPTKEVGLSIPISCAAGRASLSVNINPAPAPKPGDAATVSVHDGY